MKTAYTKIKEKIQRKKELVETMKKAKTSESIPPEIPSNSKSIEQSFLARKKINNYLKENFPDKEGVYYYSSDTIKNLGKVLNKFVDNNQFDDLKYVLENGSRLLKINHSTGHNFILNSYNLLNEKRDFLDFLLNETKELAKEDKYANVSVSNVLELYKKSNDKEEYEKTICESKRISNALDNSFLFRISNIYQESRKTLGESNLEKIVSVVENISKEGVEYAREIFSYEVLNNFENLNTRSVSKFIELVNSIEDSNKSYFDSISEAKKYLFQCGAPSFKKIFEGTGLEFTNYVLNCVAHIIKKDAYSANNTLIGLNEIIHKEEEFQNKINLDLSKDTLNILESVEQHPFSREFVYMIYDKLKDSTKKEVSKDIIQVDNLAKKIDSDIDNVFKTYNSMCRKYSPQIVGKVKEHVEQQSINSPKVARTLFYEARDLLDHTKKGEEGFKIMAYYAKELALKDEDMACDLIRYGKFILRDYGAKGLQDIITAATILKKYGDSFYTYMMQGTGAVKVK